MGSRSPVLAALHCIAQHLLHFQAVKAGLVAYFQVLIVKHMDMRAALFLLWTLPFRCINLIHAGQLTLLR